MSGCCSDHGHNQCDKHSSDSSAECSHNNDNGQKVKTPVAKEQEPRDHLEKSGEADAKKKGK